ncbi:uncharacterized protein FFC1_08910 [Fusarium fujikuroi]|nr:uncharacterized protein FFC1_08910 [Fusarium fujikuroi]
MSLTASNVPKPFNRLAPELQRMILEYAVVDDEPRILPECKTLPPSDAKASVWMESISSIRLTCRDFHATINDIFQY